AMRARELERVLQQVSDHCGESLLIGFDRHFGLDGHHRQCDAFGVGLQRCGRYEFGDESRHEEPLSILHAVRETDLGERSTNETACSQEASLDRPCGASSDSDVPSLKYLERNNRGVEQVPQFMSEEACALVPSRGLV